MSERLVVEGLHLSHRPGADGAGGRPLLSGVDLTVAPGEFVALVGASGSGKTLTAMSVLGLLPPQVHRDAGTIRLGDTDLARAGEAELNRVRGGRIGMLYQQPQRMFNPRRTVGEHLREPLRLHAGLRGTQARARTLELLAEVGFEDPRWCARARPHQLSGGMAQRAMVALALAGRPGLLLADEPTSALDTVLERQILELIDRERRDRGLGVLYITHNLATVSAYADRVVVLDAGRVQESGPAGTVLNDPRSTCTKALLEASALTPTGTPPATGGARPLVVLDELTKRFGPKRREARPAVDRVSLDLREGEILGVLGQSGSGKSTLARLVVGLEAPDGSPAPRAPAAPAPARRPRTCSSSSRTRTTPSIPACRWAPAWRPPSCGTGTARPSNGVRASTRWCGRWDWSRSCWTGVPASAPEASCSGSPSPEPCCWNRRCSSATRPPRPWTR